MPVLYRGSAVPGDLLAHDGCVQLPVGWRWLTTTGSRHAEFGRELDRKQADCRVWACGRSSSSSKTAYSGNI